MTKEYVRLKEEFQIEYVIEKSRFIATAAPCETEEEAQAFIQRISKKYWDATHNCTAYCLGPNQEQQRSSDNGEPSGTAGKPMLEVLKKTGITNTAIVVTRYFGGIKLGAGGLIRAYSHSAAIAVKEGPKLLITPRLLLLATIDYSLFSTLEQYLQSEGLTYSSEFGEKVMLTIYVKPEDTDALSTKLIDLSHGSVTLEKGPITEVDLPYTATL